ncbi:hypothetical protein HDU87_001572 [Geranomyces variabilis]|uniref:SGNH hydrolase-type esterase domain-containing protein n=1 Tax=Geranomyces variabilis TaxID=109894 RepID=A0AAD5TM77_9FUNG|nr:hypothetical protein HDU87_001572 [Geranomyces variabilis]
MDENTTADFNVLLLGASLTEGYTNNGTVMHPYEHEFVNTLSAHPPFLHRAVKTINAGVSGDHMTGTLMRPRLELHLAKAAAAGKPFDLVVIWGGANDVGWRVPVPEISAAIRGTHAAARAHGARVLALTITEWDVELRDSRIAADIATLNAELRERMATNDDDGWALFDMRKAFPRPKISADNSMDDRDELWCDGIHPSARGYDSVGILIAHAVLSLFFCSEKIQ